MNHAPPTPLKTGIQGKGERAAEGVVLRERSERSLTTREIEEVDSSENWRKELKRKRGRGRMGGQEEGRNTLGWERTGKVIRSRTASPNSTSAGADLVGGNRYEGRSGAWM